MSGRDDDILEDYEPEIRHVPMILDEKLEEHEEGTEQYETLKGVQDSVENYFDKSGEKAVTTSTYDHEFDARGMVQILDEKALGADESRVMYDDHDAALNGCGKGRIDLMEAKNHLFDYMQAQDE